MWQPRSAALAKPESIHIYSSSTISDILASSSLSRTLWYIWTVTLTCINTAPRSIPSSLNPVHLSDKSIVNVYSIMNKILTELKGAFDDSEASQVHKGP